MKKKGLDSKLCFGKPYTEVALSAIMLFKPRRLDLICQILNIKGLV